MQNLPTAEVYEKEFKYMPWGILISELLGIISKLPQNAKVLDLMCGPGYLLGKINQIRPDLSFTGVDLEIEFIEHAKDKYENINFIHADAFSWITDVEYDLVLTTAGLHHLPHNIQESFLSKISNLLADDGMAIIADPYIDDFSSEIERKVASSKLGYEYLVATIKNGGEDDVIKAAVDVMTNDIFLVEWKNSINKIKPIIEKYFSKVELHKTWPDFESEYGDYYFLLKK